MNKAMIDPTTIECLLAVDTSFIRIPDYSKKTNNGEDKDIYFLKNTLRFIPYCNNLDDANRKSGGSVVGRALAEAAWCKTVIKIYKRMDVAKQERDGFLFWRNLGCVNDCLRQVSSDHHNFLSATVG
jgi:hypothetical protein